MVSFSELSNTLTKLGYENKGYQISRAIFENLTIPVIVKIQNDPRFPHFVVAINHKGDFITILDPSFGEYISSKKQFYSIWDKDNKGGYALIFNKEYSLKLPNESLVKG